MFKDIMTHKCYQKHNLLGARNNVGMKNVFLALEDLRRTNQQRLGDSSCLPVSVMTVRLQVKMYACKPTSHVLPL